MNTNYKAQNRLTTTKAIIYGLGVCGLQLFMGYVNGFQTQFYRDMYSGLDANILYVVAFVTLVAKLLSCFADPLIGSLIDRSHLKGGKVRPWIGIGTLPIALFTTLLFIYIPFDRIGGATGRWLMYAYIAITTVCWNIAFSLADIPAQGMLPLLSPSSHERNKAAGITNTLKSIAGSIPGVFVTFIMLILTSVTHKNSEDIGYVRTYYLATALVFFFLGAGLYSLNFFVTKERVHSYSHHTVTAKEMFVELKRNKMMRLLFISGLIGFMRGMMGTIVVQTGAVLIGKVYVPLLSNLLAHGEPMDPASNATWLAGITSAVTSMISFVTVPFINKKLGERKTFLLFSLYGFCVALTCTIIYFCLPADSALRGGMPALIMIWVMNTFIGYMYGTHGYLPMIMTADIIDYQEWKTGERREGVDYAILSMATKISTALAVGFGILMVAISGYVVGAPITVKMQNILFAASVTMPGAGCMLAMIPIFWYKIDEKTKQKMHKELAERRAIAAQERGEADTEEYLAADNAENTAPAKAHRANRIWNLLAQKQLSKALSFGIFFGALLVAIVVALAVVLPLAA